MCGFRGNLPARQPAVITKYNTMLKWRRLRLRIVCIILRAENVFLKTQIWQWAKLKKSLLFALFSFFSEFEIVLLFVAVDISGKRLIRFRIAVGDALRLRLVVLTQQKVDSTSNFEAKNSENHILPGAAPAAVRVN